MFVALASGVFVAPQLKWRSASIFCNFMFTFHELIACSIDTLMIEQLIDWIFWWMIDWHWLIELMLWTDDLMCCDGCAFALTHCTMSLLMGRHVLRFAICMTVVHLCLPIAQWAYWWAVIFCIEFVTICDFHDLWIIDFVRRPEFGSLNLSRFVTFTICEFWICEADRVGSLKLTHRGQKRHTSLK